MRYENILSKIHLHKLFYTTSRQHRVSILSAYLVHPFASSRHFPSRGNESVTGLAVCVIWHDKHSGDWLTAFATPYPAVPDFPLCRGQNKTPRDNLLINPPLEMTVLADPLSSFRPQRSGVEKSPSPNGTGSITANDLRAQSIMGAVSICPIATRSPARDDDVGERQWIHLRCEGSKGS